MQPMGGYFGSAMPINASSFMQQPGNDMTGAQSFTSPPIDMKTLLGLSNLSNMFQKVAQPTPVTPGATAPGPMGPGAAGGAPGVGQQSPFASAMQNPNFLQMLRQYLSQQAGGAPAAGGGQ